MQARIQSDLTELQLMLNQKPNLKGCQMLAGVTAGFHSNQAVTPVASSVIT